MERVYLKINKHVEPPVSRSAKSSKADFTAVSLFSGCGGFCDGIEMAGFDVRVSVELDRFAIQSYKFNFPKTPLVHGDVSDFLKDSAEGTIRKYKLRHIDLVFGGPPCQGYSQIGTRDLLDERNILYKQFSRVVNRLRPRMFLMENVPNLLLMNRGQFRDEILQEFRRIGYGNATFVKVTSADFGVPQVRQRVVFLGVRDEDEFTVDLRQAFEAALDSLRVRRHFTVDEALSDLPKHVVPSGGTLKYPISRSLSQLQKMMRLDFSLGAFTKAAKNSRGIGSLPRLLYNHHTKEIQQKRARLISFLKQGAKGDSLPKHIWNGARPEKWRRLHPAAPSYTILAQMHRDLSEWIHPHLDRWITVREAARLQSFHDGFVFQGSEWQQLKQLGNAVPPILALALGRAAKTVLNDSVQKPATRSRRFGVKRRLPRQSLAPLAKIGERE
jgi:DNA (cytosine-5)-methyltransferase 1